MFRGKSVGGNSVKGCSPATTGVPVYPALFGLTIFLHKIIIEVRYKYIPFKVAANQLGEV